MPSHTHSLSDSACADVPQTPQKQNDRQKREKETKRENREKERKTERETERKDTGRRETTAGFLLPQTPQIQNKNKFLFCRVSPPTIPSYYNHIVT